MHNPVNTVISFGLLVAVVGGSFFYVYSEGPVELPKEPWIGITDGLFLTPDVGERLGLNQQQGLLVYAIAPGSPTDKAGLKGANNVTAIDGEEIPIGGDIVISIDDRPLIRPEDVCAALTQKKVGDSVRFVIDSDGDVRELDVILEELPSQVRSAC